MKRECAGREENAGCLGTFEIEEGRRGQTRRWCSVACQQAVLKARRSNSRRKVLLELLDRLSGYLTNPEAVEVAKELRQELEAVRVA